MKITHITFALILGGAAAFADSANAPKSLVTRKDLLTAELEPTKEVARVLVKEVTIPPRTPTGRHLHPVPTVGVVLEGKILFQVHGQPVQHLTAGQAFTEPANTVIDFFDNEGDTPARLSAYYLMGPNDREIIRLLDKE